MPSMVPSPTTPPFPEIGSVTGKSSQYFCVGRLGRGTFCSVHKCVNLAYSHDDQNARKPSKRRFAAAKVELETFTNSGVLEGEAMVLKHLAQCMPSEFVPAYYDYVRIPPKSSSSGSSGSGAAAGISAIVMEYLPGEDMHLLRDKHCASLQQSNDKSSGSMRRVCIEDAVYLTADCLLPLLKAMHEVGIIHRDVKPSNCVRTGTTSGDRKFKILDFGLSKSFVVPQSSPLSDKGKIWEGKWCVVGSGVGENASPKGCLRKERPKADFRGTSMYASLRVHQNRDYAMRDDLWSLMYVFCDLVSGGLPWMVNAAGRDREMCWRIKEKVHGEGEHGETGGCVDELLMGAAYHLNKGKGIDVTPLKMANDQKKIALLKKAFGHLATLGFGDMPDFNLIDGCLRGFLDGVAEDDFVQPIDWDVESRSATLDKMRRNKRKRKRGKWDSDDEDDDNIKKEDVALKKEPSTDTDIDLDRWSFPNLQTDIVTPSVLEKAERERQSQIVSTPPSSESTPTPEAESSRYDISLQMRVAQAEYNAQQPNRVPKPIALRDWMSFASLLVDEPWDVSRYERRGRKINDGYRNEEYIKLARRCLDCAKAFSNFNKRAYFNQGVGTKAALSTIFLDLRGNICKEGNKGFAPPPSISIRGQVVSP